MKIIAINALFLFIGLMMVGMMSHGMGIESGIISYFTTE